MDQLDWNEVMRLLDDEKVSQVSQFEEMTSRTGFHLVMIIPFNYTPDLCVSGVIQTVRKMFQLWVEIVHQFSFL